MHGLTMKIELLLCDIIKKKKKEEVAKTYTHLKAFYTLTCGMN